MTIRADLLALLRSGIDEATAGFYSDSVDLYPFLNAGQNLCYQNLLTAQKNIRRLKDPDYECEALRSLIGTSNITAGVQATVTMNFTTPTGNLTLTAVNRGTDGNNITGSIDDTNGSGVSISCTYTTAWVIAINWQGGTSTCNDIVTAINAHAIAGTLITASTTTGTALIDTDAEGWALTGGTGSSSFTLPTDMIEIHSCELLRTSATADSMRMTYLPYNDFKKRTLNTYTGHKYDTSTYRGEVLCAMDSATTLITSFTTWDTHWEYIKVYYYKKPTAISSSTDPTLPPQCIEAILEYAIYYALLKDKVQIAYQHKAIADKQIQIITGL